MKVARFVQSLVVAGAVVLIAGGTVAATASPRKAAPATAAPLKAAPAKAAQATAAPLKAAAATCSGSSCLTLSIPEDSVRRFPGQIAIVALVDLTGAPVAEATMTVHLTPGLHFDTSSVFVNPKPVPPSQVTVNGNDVTFPLGAFDRNSGSGADFRLDVVSGTAADQTVSADLAFRSTDGAPTATATSNVYVIHPGPELAVKTLFVLRPDELIGPAIPHGYTSDAWFPTVNTGLATVSAGGSVRVRVSAGFQLVAGGVRFGISTGDENVRGGSGGTTLRCTGGPQDETCTGIPAVPPGEQPVLGVRVAVPDRTPVGTAGTVSITVIAPGDTDTADNAASLPMRSGPVARLTYAMTIDHATVVVGTNARVTITVHNSGPQSAAGWTAYVDGDFFDPGAIRLHAVETSGLDAGQTHATLVFFHVATLAPGQTWTRHVTLSARHVDTASLRLGRNDPNPRTFDPGCPTLICTVVPRVRVSIVAASTAPTKPPTTTPTTTPTGAPAGAPSTTGNNAGGPTLATTGSDDAGLALGGAGLLVAGLALMLVGRRRPSGRMAG